MAGVGYPGFTLDKFFPRLGHPTERFVRNLLGQMCHIPFIRVLYFGWCFGHDALSG